MSPLKLFIVGESSGDPEEWSAIGPRMLVVAHDAQEALRIADGYGTREVAEVPLVRPCELFSFHDPRDFT